MVAGSVALALAGCGDEPTPVAPHPAEPDAPADVRATRDAATGHITVTWSAAANAATYTVQRNLPGSGRGFADLRTGIAGTSHVDADPPNGVLQYRVVAVGPGGSSPASDPAEVVGEPVRPPAANLSGAIGGTRALSADTVYTLRGVVTVEDGGLLRIPAGATVLASTSPGDWPTALIVKAGGQLRSEGTEDAPVVFTSDDPPEERHRGDWAGVVLNGRSLCNWGPANCVGSGGAFGGDDRHDDSGVIAYTRIEYAGAEFSFGRHLAALTLNGVGDGTTIHHVQVHEGAGDGFEWHGGTVNAHHLLATEIRRNAFHYSNGFQGMGQFWLAQHDSDGVGDGLDAEGNPDDFDAEPFTVPLLANLSLIGDGPNALGSAEGYNVDGMLLHFGTGGHILNALVIGFGNEGLDINHRETRARLRAGLLGIRNSIIALNRVPFGTQDEDAIFATDGWGNRLGADPMLAAPFDRANPDFRPRAGSPALEGAAGAAELLALVATLPAELRAQFATAATFFDFTADYVGAVGPDDDWTRERWTTLGAREP